MPHGRQIKEERTEIRIWNFSLDGSSHQTGDEAFTPATPHDLHHSRANTDPHNSHNTQHTRVKQSTLRFTQKDTQPSQTCSGGNITPNPNKSRCGWCLFAYGEYKLDYTRLIMSWIRRQNNPPGRLVRFRYSFYKSFFFVIRGVHWGHINDRKHMSGRFRSHFQKKTVDV